MAELARRCTTGSSRAALGDACAADRGHRSRALDPENVAQILDALRWLELDWDEGPLSQAERAERHTARITELLDSGKAYPDTATAEEVRAFKRAHGNAGVPRRAADGEGAAIRLRVPDDGETVVDDLIRGPVRFENRLTDDLVIARGDGPRSTTSPSLWTTPRWGSPT